ncbi:unnamed protein product [Calypogeia fissa]
MEARTIELKVVSATNLKKVKKFGSAQQRCYVVAYIYAAQRQATQADSAGGVNPTWNAPLTLLCYETDLYPDYRSGSSFSTRPSSSSAASSSSSSRAITIEIYAHSSGIFSSGDKLVGTVVIPLRDIASAVPAENLTSMAFDVRRPSSGRVKGKLNLTVKLGPKFAITGDPAAYQQQMPSYAYHNRKMENTPPLVTSYNTASSEPSSLGLYDPTVNTYGKQEVVTGYPAPGYGFAPLGPLPPGRLQPYGQAPYVNNGLVAYPNGRATYVNQTPERTRRQKRDARRAQRAADPDRKARRKRRLKLGAMIVGGIILGLILL